MSNFIPEQSSISKAPLTKVIGEDLSFDTSASSDLKCPLFELSQVINHPHVQPELPKSKQLLKKGSDLIKDNRIGEAIPVLQKCIEMDPNIDDNFLGLGCYEDRVGYHYGTLWEWVCLSNKGKEKQASPYDLLSLCISMTGASSEHKQWYKNMLKTNQNNYKLIFGLANVEYSERNFHEAIALYKEVIKEQRARPEAYVKIALIYCLKWNKEEEAQQWANQVIKLDQQNFYAMLVKALCKKNLEERIKELKKLIEFKPDFARVYNGLGNAYYNLRQYESAIKCYKESIEISSQYEHPYYGLGSIYNQMGNHQESIKWYTKCIEVCPNYDYPHYGLGIAYNNKGDIPNAIFWFKECIRVNPQYDCPYYALGNIYRLAKDYKQAINYYESSIKLKPVDPLCLVNVALSHIMIEEFELGLSYLEQAQKYQNSDRTLTNANNEYIKEQLDKHLKEVDKHQRNCSGYVTLRDKIKMKKMELSFKEEFVLLYGSNSE